MKKFIITIAIGYLLIMFLFFGLPKIMSLRKSGSKEQNASSSQTAQMTQEGVPGGIAGSKDGKVKADKPGSFQKMEKEDGTGAIETFYKTGTLSSQWLVHDETAVADFLTFYPEGGVWMEMHFIHKRIEGTVKTFYRSGAIFREEIYSHGLKQGMSITYYENGKIWIKALYEQGILQNIPELYSENGTRASPPQLKTEDQNSYFKVYDENGEIVMNWQQAGSEQVAELKTFFETGMPSSEWTIKNNRIQGTVKIYDPEQGLYEERHYQQGLPAGLWRTYYNDGQTWIRTEHDSEKKSRMMEVYYPGGLLWFVLDEKPDAKSQAIQFKLTTYWQEMPENRKEVNLL
ncbi:MAG: hypothetical protein H6757_03185 [Candidatus Omnitrophica bacterium]|nr:hypothetical protein [Candidatus Omnitrophota bacterium]